ncbi:8-oxo-dGTP diphosphatase MutT [Geminocystis sp. GBBB08]|uniref:8-oxo-dGTP diphosphatase MutT n=1 Tax=Geminocystis sp. GBBB08 TaxID=2604140 RepID=UPI0027E287DF|nr:8-oxo-dGTP diphosphatase MutT [Geminocystis sp. GBBB08]MBL1209061.1 8-oxo-dGTP diphosphatase MutT [Geminocystis sp. GBBB08]
MINKQTHQKIGVAVIINQKQEILIDKRLPTGLMANLWEFPGGKIKQGETYQECIKREIKEELGVDIAVNHHLIDITHTYSEFTVTLSVYICQIITGEPEPLECAEIRWVTISQLHNFEFPSANKAIISALENNNIFTFI